jgi:hypothetical protein
MITVNKTVGTPGAVSLCTGKGIFHRNGTDLTIPLGYETSYTLWHQDNGSCGGDFYVGICGPAWALKMDLVGEASGNKLTLDPPTYECNAGMMMGLGLTTFSVSAHVSMLFSEFTWSITVAEVDFLKILVWAYEQWSGKKLFPEEKPSAFTTGSFGMNHDAEGKMDSSLAIVRSPKVVLEWDLLESFIAWTAPYAIPEYNTLKWFAELSFGPEFQITLNVNLKMAAIKVGGVEYKNLTYDSVTNKVVGTTTSATEPTTTDPVQVTFHETPSINFGLGFFFELKIAQLFCVRVDYFLNVLDGLGFTLSGEYDQTVDSGSFSGACSTCAPGNGPNRVYEVEFA